MYLKCIYFAHALLELLYDSSNPSFRFPDFILPPLTFYEYIHLKSYQHLLIPQQINWNDQTLNYYNTIDVDRLNQLFVDYINYGGYPEVVFFG